MEIRVPNPLSDTAEEWAKYIRALWNDRENQKRKEASKLVIDYYRFKQLGYLEEQLKKVYTDPYSYARKRKWVHNYTKQIIDALAQCYSAKIRRNVGSVKSKKKLVEIEELMFNGLNKTMANANRWLMLERTTLLFTKWSEKYQRMIYRSYNQFQFDLIFDPESDEKELLGVILSDYKSLDDSNIYVYTKNKTYQFRGDKLINEIQHNMDILPFVVMYAEDPGFEDYLEPLTELAHANLELNVAHSNLLNVLHNQAHGILILRTPPDEPFAGIDDTDPNQSHPTTVESDRRIDAHDPNKMVVLTIGPNGEMPSLDSLKQEADFTGAIETIRFKANSLANTFGLDHGIFEVQVSTNPATVFHINEKRRQAIIGDFQAIFMDAEKELFDKAYQLAKKSRLELAELDTKKFTVEFSPDKAMLEKMTVQDILKALESGIVDTVEAVRQIYPSLNRTEAIQFIEEMAKDESLVRSLREKLLQAEKTAVPQSQQQLPEVPKEERQINNQTP